MPTYVLPLFVHLRKLLVLRDRQPFLLQSLKFLPHHADITGLHTGSGERRHSSEAPAPFRGAQLTSHCTARRVAAPSLIGVWHAPESASFATTVERKNPRQASYIYGVSLLSWLQWQWESGFVPLGFFSFRPRCRSRGFSQFSVTGSLVGGAAMWFPLFPLYFCWLFFCWLFFLLDALWWDCCVFRILVLLGRLSIENSTLSVSRCGGKSVLLVVRVDGRATVIHSPFPGASKQASSSNRAHANRCSGHPRRCSGGGCAVWLLLPLATSEKRHLSATMVVSTGRRAGLCRQPRQRCCRRSGGNRWVPNSLASPVPIPS